MGKSFVGTANGGANDLKEVIKIAQSPFDFLENIEKALHDDNNDDILKRKNIAFKNSWHNREYTPFEVRKLLEAGGFEIDLLQTITNSKNQSLILRNLLLRLFGNLLSSPAFLAGRVPLGMRGGSINVRAKKIGPVLDRYPDFLYELYGASKVDFKIPLKLIHKKLKEES